MGTAEFHYLVGKYLAAREDETGRARQEPAGGGLPLRRADLHVVARRQLHRHEPGRAACSKARKLRIDPLRDVNQSAAIVCDAKKKGGRSGVLILGGGSPKNFMLQTEPQIQEVLGLEESGHDYFLQVTDARPDTGGLSGATPQEAMTWGKVDPEQLPDTVTCYVDSTIALPLLTVYALATRAARAPRRLMERMDDLMRLLEEHYHTRSPREKNTKEAP